jgi:hypothetical protein
MIRGICLVAGLWLSYQFGWYDAHRTVARECEILGGFYIGKNLNRADHYICSLKERK